MIIDQPTAFIMIIPKSVQFQISPVASPEILHNTTQYQNLAFHSSLKWKMLILLLTTSSTLSEIWQGPNLLSAFQRFRALESVYLERVDCNTVTYNIITECFSYLLISKLQPTYHPWILVVLSRNTSCICHHTGRRLMQRAYTWIFQVQPQPREEELCFLGQPTDNWQAHSRQNQHHRWHTHALRRRSSLMWIWSSFSILRLCLNMKAPESGSKVQYASKREKFSW